MEKYIFYGAGQYAKDYFTEISNKYEPLCFCDRAVEEMESKTLYGHPILPPSAMLAVYPEVPIVITISPVGILNVLVYLIDDLGISPARIINCYCGYGIYDNDKLQNMFDMFAFPPIFTQNYALHNNGLLKEAYDEWDDLYHDFDINYLKENNIADMSLRFFSSTYDCIGHYGFIAMFHKMKVLGLIPNFNFNMDTRIGKYNRFLANKVSSLVPYANLKKMFMPDYIRHMEYNIFNIKFTDNKFYDLPVACAIAEREWRIKGYAPILSLSDTEINRGKEELSKYGVPSDAWFVGLHVRNDLNSINQNVRNCDLSTYIPAINYITNMGGYVIRIGDLSMQPLPDMMNVVDLSQVVSNDDGFLHTYVLAASRFFIGCDSGPSLISYLFGVPTIVTNAPLPFQFWDPGAILLPRLIKNLDGNLLTVDEIVNTPEALALDANVLIENGFSVKYNSSDEIIEAIEEMLEELVSPIMHTECPEDVYEWSKIPGRILSRFDCPGAIRVGRKFAKRYDYLL